MAAQSPPFALQNSAHSAALFRQAVSSFLQAAGVLAPGDMAVTAQSTPNMSVQVAAGRAWMTGTQVSNVAGGSFSTQAAYFGLNDAPATVTIATANATNPRIDVVYAAVQDSFYSGSNNQLVIGVVTGTPAASPIAPAVPTNAVALANVAVAANATSIVGGNIASWTTSLTGQASVLGTPLVSSSSTRPTNVRLGQLEWDTDTGAVNMATAGTGTSTTWSQIASTGMPVAALRQATAQTSLPVNAWQTITFDAEDIDTHGGHSNSSNNSRYTVPSGQGGTYVLDGGITTGALGAGVLVEAQIIKNGAQLPAGLGNYGGYGSSTGTGVTTGMKVLTLNAGDYVQLQGQVSGSGTWTTSVGGALAPWLNIWRIR